MPKVKFFTVGCKVNQYETQLMREIILSHLDFEEVEGSCLSDLYIINTCTVTHRADRDSLNLIRKAREENPLALIVACGCLTELDSEKIKGIDRRIIIVRNKEKKELLKKLPFTNYRLPINNYQGISYFKGHTRAFLKIQDGCNNFCSYCKVPLVRGPSISKELEKIIEEFKNLISNGYKEIVLCGVSLGSFGKDLKENTNLIRLLESLDNLQGDFRIRLSSLEAWDIDDEFMEKINKIKKLCPHLHIPMQSGDSKILKLMNRPISPEFYLEKIEKLKEKIPDLVITTDVLVGFPQEEEENFLNTLNLIKKIKPLKVHIFSFSPRPYTRAFHLEGKINEKEIKRRIDFLKEEVKKISYNVKQEFLGKSMRVLFESKEKEACWVGFTDNYLKVKLLSKEDLKNRFLEVKLSSLRDDYILANL